jgi:hypothetical protein
VSPHFPVLHAALAWAAALHIVPQAPQLLGSVCSFTHAPWQFSVPAAQFEVHLPAAQT